MPFEQGNNYGKGRPSGASNKSTEIVKQNVVALLENNIQLIQEDLDQMTPRDSKCTFTVLYTYSESCRIENLTS